MTNITEQWSITINVDGVDHTFADPHPITDLVDRLNAETLNLEQWQTLAATSQASIDDIKAQIVALCS